MPAETPAEIAPSHETIVTPSLKSNLDLLELRLNRLEAESVDFAGTNSYPEWWQKDADNTRVQGIRSQLKKEDADLSNVSRYFELYCKEIALGETMSGRPRTTTNPIGQLTHELGGDVVGRGFGLEPVDGPLHKAMLEVLGQANGKTYGDVITPELEVLRTAYGLETMTDLLGVGGNEYDDKLRGVLLHKHAIRWIRFNEQERNDDYKWAEVQETARVWMTKALQAASGIDAEEASDYVFSASRRGEDQAIVDVISKFDYFGVDRIRKITEFTGIHGLEVYTVGQLERMEALATDPEGVAKRLEQHDVNVVLNNRFGDHNGVMGNVAADFDDDTERTLFFEITRLEDIYKRVSTLKKSGIKPSTLVLAAHSAPGQFTVSDLREIGHTRHDVATIASRKLVAMANGSAKLEPGVKAFAFSMHGMKGMARLVEDYMRPSRALDDDASDIGRKKIIFQACYAASEIKQGDVDENNEKYQIGTESVISQLGKDLAASGIKSAVDIYGAPAGIQMHRTSFGVRYSGQLDLDIGERTPMQAERVRVEHGHIEKQVVDEITLRKIK